MDQVELNRMDALVRDFYESRAESFAHTRQTPWHGWTQILRRLPEPRTVLDVGCGNGRFLGFMRNRGTQHPFSYEGWDVSNALLRIADRHRPAAVTPTVRWVHRDILRDPWPDPRTHDLVVAWGLMHHVAGMERRLTLLLRLLERVAPGGSLVVSYWKPLHDARLATKAKPTTLGPHDVWLPWERGNHGRYCHSFRDQELREHEHKLIEAGTRVQRFDGLPGDNDQLNTYLLATRAHTGTRPCP